MTNIEAIRILESGIYILGNVPYMVRPYANAYDHFDAVTTAVKALKKMEDKSNEKLYVVSDGAGCCEYELLGIYSSFDKALDSCKNVFIKNLPYAGNCLRVEEWNIDNENSPIIHDIDSYYTEWINEAVKTKQFCEMDYKHFEHMYNYKEVNEE